MYITSGGAEMYEAPQELVGKGVISAWDYKENYYVVVKSDDRYDSRIWIVNKKTKQISYGFYPIVMSDIIDDATPVDAETLKRAFA